MAWSSLAGKQGSKAASNAATHPIISSLFVWGADGGAGDCIRASPSCLSPIVCVSVRIQKQTTTRRSLDDSLSYNLDTGPNRVSLVIFCVRDFESLKIIL